MIHITRKEITVRREGTVYKEVFVRTTVWLFWFIPLFVSDTRFER